MSDTPAGLTLPPEGYADWLADLKSRIHTAQQRATLAVNRELVLLYWQIGRDILARQAGFSGLQHEQMVLNHVQHHAQSSQRLYRAVGIHCQGTICKLAGGFGATSCCTIIPSTQKVLPTAILHG